MSLSIQPLLSLKINTLLNFYYNLILPILEIHIREIIEDVLFNARLRLLLLRTMTLRFMQVVCINSLFLYLLNSTSVYKYIAVSLFFFDGYLIYFQFLTIINKADISIFRKLFLKCIQK